MPQLSTVAKPLRLPLVAPLQSRTSEAPFTKDARLYNGFAEHDPVTEGFQLFKRPGLGPAVVGAGGPAPGLGIYTETGINQPFAVIGGTIGSWAPNNPTATFGPIMSGLSTAGPYFFETLGQASATARYVVFSNGGLAYGMTLDSGPPFHRQVVQQITDSNFPSNQLPPIPLAWGFVALDGILYVMDVNGSIWGATTANNPFTWSALNVIEASSNADLGVGIAKQLNYLIAFKQYTTQVFYDAGNPPPGSALAPVADAQIPLGCLAGTSIQQIDNTLLWLSSNETISPQVVQMDNLVPKVVSTPGVERILDNITWAGTFSNPNLWVRSWILKHAGHRFYGLTLVTNNLTLVYDIDQKQWYFWTDPNGNFWPIVGMAYANPGQGNQGVHYALHYSNGNVYPLDGDYAFPNDYGNLFPVDIYTPNFDAGTTRRKMLNDMYFVADRTAGSILNVRYSDDDYTTWSNFRNVDLSRYKPRLVNCGTFKQRRAWHMRHLCNTPLRIQAVDLQIDIGVL